MTIFRSWRVPALVLVAIFAGLFASASHEIGKNRLAAFTCYYRAAVAMRAGQSPYDAGSADAYPYVYPPFYAFACGPLTRLPPQHAARVMLAINTCFVLGAILLAARSITPRLTGDRSPSAALWVALVTTIIAVVQIHKELGGLQAGVILGFSYALSLYWLDRRPALAGLALALAISVKYVPIITLPYLLWRRRWRAVVACLAGSVAFAMLPAVSLGWSTNLRFLASANAGLARIVGMPVASGSAQVHSLDDPLNVSVTGAMARLVKHAGLPSVVGSTLTASFAAIWLITIVNAYRRQRAPLLTWPAPPGQARPPYEALLALEWAGIVTFALSFSPNTQLAQAIVPVTLVATLLCDPPADRAGRRGLALAAGTLIAALYLPMAATGRHFTVLWNLAGTPAWLQLAAYVAVLPLVLSRARARAAMRSQDAHPMQSTTHAVPMAVAIPAVPG